MKGRKIFLIEDQKIEALAVIREFGDLGFEVRWEQNSRLVIHGLSKDRYDIVITDYDLGPRRQNGAEVTNLIKLMYADLPVVMYTGNLRPKFGARSRPNKVIEKGKIDCLIMAVLDLIGD